MVIGQKGIYKPSSSSFGFLFIYGIIMFERFKSRRRDKALAKWLSKAYDPLFESRYIVAREIVLLTQMVGYLVKIQNYLNDPTDKDDEHMIRGKWQALKIDPIIEHYKLAIEKLNEVLINTPSEPEEKETYNFDYYGPDHDES